MRAVEELPPYPSITHGLESVVRNTNADLLRFAQPQRPVIDSGVDHQQDGAVQFFSLLGRDALWLPKVIEPALFPRVAFPSSAWIVDDQPVVITSDAPVSAHAFDLELSSDLL